MDAIKIVIVLFCIVCNFNSSENDTPSNELHEIKVQGFTTDSGSSMCKSFVVNNAIQTAVKHIEGFDYMYHKKDGFKFMRTRTSSMIKRGEKPTEYKTIKLGDRSIMMCECYFVITDEKRKAIEEAKKGAEKSTFEIFVSTKNPGTILGMAINEALSQHFEAKDMAGPITGHGWLEEGVELEAAPLPDDKNRVKVKIVLSWNRKAE